MKIGINDGHTLRGAGTGAVGIIKEGEHTRLVGEEVRRLLKEKGNTVYNCTVDYASAVNESLSLVVQQANSGLMSIFWTQKVKLFYAALLANNSHCSGVM